MSLGALLDVTTGASRRGRIVAAVAIVVCVAAGLAGLVDHLVGDSAIRLAELQAHYCIHGPKPPGVNCNAVDPDGMERAWHWRELGYLAVMAAASAAIVATLLPKQRRSRVAS